MLPSSLPVATTMSANMNMNAVKVEEAECARSRQRTQWGKHPVAITVAAAACFLGPYL